MKYITAPQGSDAWLQARVGKITASRCKDARDRNKPAKGETIGKPSAKCTAYAAQVAVERIAGRPVDKLFESWQMREGSEQEPHARHAYDVETGNIVHEVGAIATEDDLFLYSPDGLIGDEGLLEIKTLLSADRILRIVGEGDLSDFMDQCLMGLWLTGRKWIDLVLWCPALEPIGRQLTVQRITRVETAIEQLETDLMAFAQMVRRNEQLLRGAANEDLVRLAAWQAA
jgi:exodeoxyribonuclease (lambda-induced)